MGTILAIGECIAIGSYIGGSAGGVLAASMDRATIIPGFAIGDAAVGGTAGGLLADKIINGQHK